MSNSKKNPQPKWLRRPKSQQEKREFGKAKEEGVSVRGKRSPRHLGDEYDDKQIESNIKKQNKNKKPSRDTIRYSDEDEQTISKQMKTDGKATFDGPKVKDRKHFAPATKVEKPKKGKGSYDRKENKTSFNEDTDIINFLKCILSKNYSQADKYLNKAVESKIQHKIEQELKTPLF